MRSITTIQRFALTRVVRLLSRAGYPCHGWGAGPTVNFRHGWATKETAAANMQNKLGTIDSHPTAPLLAIAIDSPGRDNQSIEMNSFRTPLRLKWWRACGSYRSDRWTGDCAVQRLKQRTRADIGQWFTPGGLSAHIVESGGCGGDIGSVARLATNHVHSPETSLPVDSMTFKSSQRSTVNQPAAQGGPVSMLLVVSVFLLGWFPSDSSADQSVTAAGGQPLSFNEHIRPILSDRCFYCHGPDGKHREAGLRLDDRDTAISHDAIVPKDADASLIIQRVLESDEDLVMPPPSSKKGRLTAKEVALLRRWIAEGAVYEPHWAFAPLKKSPPPETQPSDWPSNPIDHFVLDRLQKANLTPSPQADRATLIRRLSLDLTGLLPDPDAVSRFESDTRIDAYERLVDSLLASPHFAERWGRHWLDQARYADSNGYSIDSQRAMWPYRDWVIRAISDDMAFDEFTIQQIAGDLLPGATKMHQVASAFHRNTLINQEGGTDAEQFRNEAVADRVNTTGAVWLGLTLGCAQCHTHKFDPIEHREYYELFAFFNSGTDVNNTGATVPIEPGEVLGFDFSALKKRRADRRAQLEQRLLDDLRKQRPSTDGNSPAPQWHVVTWSDRSEMQIDGDAKFKVLDDQSLLVTGTPDPNSSYRLTIDTAPLVKARSLSQVASLRLRVLTDNSLPKSGPGLASNGNFVLTSIRVSVDGITYRPSFTIADHEQPEYPVSHAIDDDPKTGWAINVGKGSKAVMNANHEAILAFEPAIPLNENSVIKIEMEHALNADYLIGRFALDVASDLPSRIPPTDTPDDKLIVALEIPLEKRSAEQRKLVDDRLRADFPADADVLVEPEVARLMVMADLPKPRETFVSLRGDFLRPDKELGQLNPGGIAAIAPPLPAAAGRTRLDLAKWLIDPENPLTPRVTVNRIWMRYFGVGLVETEEDFGTQGTLPTHPELLDWLSRRFIDQGMSPKALHRLIVTSSTYRQASKHRGDLDEVDPRNRLLGRQNRVRVEAEIVRDAALSASGEIDRTIGGPSVHPPQPDGVYSFTQNAKRWVADTGGNRFRRAMYTEFFRSAPHPMFTTFDSPDFQTVCTRRNRSNTPLQALMVANDITFVELARALANRVVREVPKADIDRQIDHAFRLTLNRQATTDEMAILTDLHRRLVESFVNEASAEVDAWLGKDASKRFEDSQKTDAAALIAICRTLFNTDNFITRE